MKKNTIFQMIILTASMLVLVTSTSLGDSNSNGSVSSSDDVYVQNIISKGVTCAEVAVKYGVVDDLTVFLGEVPDGSVSTRMVIDWIGTPMRALRVALVSNSITLDEFLDAAKHLSKMENCTLENSVQIP